MSIWTVSNFIDPDNDNDGIADVTEVAEGSDINVTTSTITGFAPPNANALEYHVDESRRDRPINSAIKRSKSTA